MKKLLNGIARVLCVMAVCVLAGCSYAGDGGNNNPPPVLPAAPVKYTISYDAAGHGKAPEAKTVEKGYKLTEEDLQVLTADGFDFGGWKFNEKIAAAGEEVVSDMTLVAVWTEWGKAAIPTFSTAAGEVDYGTKVSIFTTTEGASIYYTTDGSEPTAASTKYESEIEITAAVTIKAIAVQSGLKDSDVVSASYTVDVTPPAAVTNLTAKCTASQTVKLTWTNPTDTDFAKVVITYGTDGKVEVLKTATPNNEATIKGLTDETEYEFTVKAYDNAGNASSGVSVKCTPGLLGGLFGTPTGGQTQGALVKESWMADNGNLKVDGIEIAKTSEVIVIPTGTVAKISMTQAAAKGDLFTDSRKVKLSPFVMSKYEVTRALFKAVMGDAYYSSLGTQATATGTEDENPVTQTNWFDAIVFCNRLSSLCGLEPVYSYNFSTDESGKMTDPDAWFADTTNLSSTVPTRNSSTNYSNWKDKVVINLKANGYRLPTEAEWEFCARGGDPNAEDWGYTYSGSNTVGEVAWYTSNSGDSGTNIAGCMNKANRLGLYDMNGNVNEWCDDFLNSSSIVDDSKYTDSEGYVKDPLVVSVSSSRRLRGGCWYFNAIYCEVGIRDFDNPYYRNNGGFRLVRSSN